MSACFFGIGLLAGVAQLLWLVRGVSRRAHVAFGWLARLTLVALLLLVAAGAGHIIACSAGWAAGFALSFGFALLRRSWT